MKDQNPESISLSYIGKLFGIRNDMPQRCSRSYHH